MGAEGRAERLRRGPPASLGAAQTWLNTMLIWRRLEAFQGGWQAGCDIYKKWRSSWMKLLAN